MIKVKEIMTKDIISVDKDVDLSYVLNLMKKHDITKIPVVEEKQLVGVVTDNIIAYKLGAKRKRGIPASRLHASSVTEKAVEKISPNVDVATILKSVGDPGPTMLCVVDAGVLVGVITKADLLPLVTSKKPVKVIMKKQIFTVSPEDRVIHARRLMIDEHIARLPVLDHGKLVGIISDTEIAFALATVKRSFSLGRQKHRLDELIVNEVMKTPVKWVEPSITISKVAKIMRKQNIGALPILQDNALIGIVTRTDLLRTIQS